VSPLPEAEAALLRRAAAFSEMPALADCTAGPLRHVAREHGVDFATALLYDRFRKSPVHAPTIARVETLLAAAPGPKAAVNWKLFVVPGALYIERPELGSGGEIVRQAAAELGISCGLVPVASRGSVQENATLIAEWLKQHGGEKLVFVTVSKGGPDMKLALARPDAPHRFRNVVAWINHSGPLDGSLAADWIPASRLRSWAVRLQYRIQRRDFGFLTDMCHGPGSPLREPLRLPAHMRLISVLGFPLRSHLTTPLGRFAHSVIARQGPNDGTVLLPDAVTWPGEILPVWGADHYFRPPERVRRLFVALLRELAG
jgi:hypothetical protein